MQVCAVTSQQKELTGICRKHVANQKQPLLCHLLAASNGSNVTALFTMMCSVQESVDVTE
jgi:hypothetical protein